MNNLKSIGREYASCNMGLVGQYKGRLLFALLNSLHIVDECLGDTFGRGQTERPSQGSVSVV
eukprot:scaffold587_cov171-Amphora_coffeaeformis.AAC.9